MIIFDLVFVENIDIMGGRRIGWYIFWGDLWGFCFIIERFGMLRDRWDWKDVFIFLLTTLICFQAYYSAFLKLCSMTPIWYYVFSMFLVPPRNFPSLTCTILRGSHIFLEEICFYLPFLLFFRYLVLPGLFWSPVWNL